MPEVRQKPYRSQARKESQREMPDMRAHNQRKTLIHVPFGRRRCQVLYPHFLAATFILESVMGRKQHLKRKLYRSPPSKHAQKDDGEKP